MNVFLAVGLIALGVIVGAGVVIWLVYLATCDAVGRGLGW